MTLYRKRLRLLGLRFSADVLCALRGQKLFLADHIDLSGQIHRPVQACGSCMISP